MQRKAFWLYLAIAVASTAVVLAILPYLMDRLIPPNLRTAGVVILILLLAGTFFDVLRGAQTLTVSAAGRTEFLFISAAGSALLMYLFAVPLVFLLGIPAIAIGYPDRPDRALCDHPLHGQALGVDVSETQGSP